MRESRSYNILLVEDNVGDSNLLKLLFENCGLPINLIVTRDGAEATEYLFGHKRMDDSANPDLVLMDLNLPKRNGRELIRDIRASHDLRTLPVIVLSTSNNETDIDDVYELGANAFITKPVDLEVFQKSVNALANFWLRCAELPRVS